MNKEELREGLHRMEEYVDNHNFKSVFLEEGEEAEMDSLVIPLVINEELSVDISCNFVHAPEIGNVLQFYGHLEMDPLFEENPEAFTEFNVLKLINEINQMIPVGQFLYMKEDIGHGKEQNVIGIRYTMLTSLEGEAELKKTVHVLLLLMQAYEILCSSLMLLLEDETVEAILKIIKGLMNI